jgi:hypothetical protein
LPPVAAPFMPQICAPASEILVLLLLAQLLLDVSRKEL